ncbi:hypothetical protein C0993_007913 [Termitomyces sp. T159_Od127]|nr:hypothetical protein C0993_007913 [Termitomyces sp. T159_Od127]
MVALSPRFAVLAAFISIASLSTSPLSVGAAVIPQEGEHSNTARSFGATRFRSAFGFAQARAMKRDDACYRCPLICSYIFGKQVLKRAQHSPHWSIGKQGNAYGVSHSSSHSQSLGSPRYPRDIAGREAQSEDGLIAITNTEEQRMGYLAVENQNDPHPKFLPVEATERNGTTFTLVKQVPGASDARGLQAVKIKTTSPDQSEPTGTWCMGYDAMKPENSNLIVSPCEESGESRMSQTFAYNETSQDILPLSSTPQTNGAQKVLSRNDGAGKQAKVYLKFLPEPTKAEDVADVADVAADAPNGGSSVATMTKTVTVTNTPTAALSASDAGATPSANASSSVSESGTVSSANASSSAAASPAVTSNGTTPSANASPSASLTSSGAAPTAGAPGTAGTAAAASVLDVEVVQASSAPSSSEVVQASSAPSAATSTGASSVSAAPTSTINPQAIASSIANSSAASSPTSSGSSAAVSSSTTGSSTSAVSSTPSARA